MIGLDFQLRRFDFVHSSVGDLRPRHQYAGPACGTNMRGHDAYVGMRKLCQRSKNPLDFLTVDLRNLTLDLQAWPWACTFRHHQQVRVLYGYWFRSFKTQRPDTVDIFSWLWRKLNGVSLWTAYPRTLYVTLQEFGSNWWPKQIDLEIYLHINLLHFYNGSMKCKSSFYLFYAKNGKFKAFFFNWWGLETAGFLNLRGGAY
jgi:hypothetical protein